MKLRIVLRPLAGLVGATWLLATACSGSKQGAAQNPKTPNEAVAATPPAPSAPAPGASAPAEPTAAVGPIAVTAASLDALPPPETDTSVKARRGLSMSESRSTVDPALKIPVPTAKLDAPTQSGVDSAIKAVPATVQVGTLSKSVLEGPLRDRSRFDHCRIPYGTHGEIAAVVYDGSALGVDVKTNPNDRALNLCIERSVRQITWVKETAVNKVKVAF